MKLKNLDTSAIVVIHLRIGLTLARLFILEWRAHMFILTRMFHCTWGWDKFFLFYFAPAYQRGSNWWLAFKCTCLRHGAGIIFLFAQLGGTKILLNRFDSGKIFLGASPNCAEKNWASPCISSRARFWLSRSWFETGKNAAARFF